MTFFQNLIDAIVLTIKDACDDSLNAKPIK